MSGLVLDASLSTTWLLDDETDPLAELALDSVESTGAIVPPLWHYEVRNALLVAERRGRIPASDLQPRLRDLRELPIETDDDADLDTALELAMAHRLSFYDALYLELARRRRLPLATRDAALVRAVRAEGLDLVG